MYEVRVPSAKSATTLIGAGGPVTLIAGSLTFAESV
jgi:hypothetical protein